MYPEKKKTDAKTEKPRFVCSKHPGQDGSMKRKLRVADKYGDYLRIPNHDVISPFIYFGRL